MSKASARWSSSPRANAELASDSTRTSSARLLVRSSANARENSRSPVAVAMPRPADGHHRRPPAPQLRGVEHVVVNQRGAVEQLDRHRDPQHPRARRLARGHEHEQRPQALAAGGDRGAAVARQHRAVAGGELGQALVERLHERRNVRAARGDDGLDRGCDRHHLPTVPWWIAMIPPAVSSQPMSRRPASSIAAASPSGPGKRLTELGR